MPTTTTPTTPTRTTPSPGTYYHAHIKPNAAINTHTALEGINAHALPSTSRPIAAASRWLHATEYAGDPRILTVWITASKKQLPHGKYYGMRIANVDSHHVGTLHGFGRKQVAREYTDEELRDRLTSSLKASL